MAAVTAFELAQRFIGVKEAPGSVSNPIVLAMLRLDNSWPSGDEVAWCSAFVNFIAWLARLPRSKSLAARSWLAVGRPISIGEAAPGDVVILKRGASDAGPDVINAPGHVGFFAGVEPDPINPAIIPFVTVHLLGGNQGDSVSVAPFPVSRILGVRRLE